MENASDLIKDMRSEAHRWLRDNPLYGMVVGTMLNEYADRLEAVLTQLNGNPSAMRKSLMEIQEYAAAMKSDEDEANAFAILDEARKGLETPARNCDRPCKTLAEFQRYYIEHGRKKGLGTVTDGEITKVPWKSQFEKWMLEPLS